MLVSVVERTWEIGIRKAVGATSSAILTQFLTESILITYYLLLITYYLLLITYYLLLITYYLLLTTQKWDLTA